jgi:large subunit ribosomal protein L5
MTLVYVHKPPGTVQQQKADRLRTWDDSSPYHKGRPKRGPRGPGDRLRIIERDFNWRDIPEIEEVTVHSMISRAVDDSAYLHVAGIMLQAITGVRPLVHRAKHNISEFGIRKSKPISLTCTMRGGHAYDFVDRCINLVFPKMKDWSGIQGKSQTGMGPILRFC